MRIAAFGTRGFIGKAFVKLTPAEHQLFIFNRPMGDVRSPGLFMEKLKECKPDVVVNMAALIGTLLSSPAVKDVFETNAMGGLNVSYAAREAGAKSYIYISSTVVHGENNKNSPLGRFAGLAPKHPYSASKAAAEYGLQQFAREGTGMPVVVLRPPMVIGEDMSTPLPPVEFARAAIQGKKIEIYGDGLHEREFVSVSDVAGGIWKAIDWSMNASKGYHPFFLTGNKISMKDLAEQVVKKFGSSIVHKPATKQAFSLTTDPSDTEKILGWKVTSEIGQILDDVGQFLSKEKLSQSS